MNGFAFILMVWLQGALAPQTDISVWISGEQENCENLARQFETIYKVGKPHPVFGGMVTGLESFCLHAPKPPDGEPT